MLHLLVDTGSSVTVLSERTFWKRLIDHPLTTDTQWCHRIRSGPQSRAVSLPTLPTSTPTRTLFFTLWNAALLFSGQVRHRTYGSAFAAILSVAYGLRCMGKHPPSCSDLNAWESSSVRMRQSGQCPPSSSARRTAQHGCVST